MKPARLLLASILALSAVPSVAAQDGGMKAMAQGAARGMTRLLSFTRGPDGMSIPFNVCVQFGQPVWKDDYDGAVKSAKNGTRHRVGNNFWTSLDTNRDLVLGGVKVPAGIYYVAVEKAADDKINLVLLDPAEVRKQHLDAFEAGKTQGGLVIPMKWEKSDKSEEKQTFKITASEKPTEATLALLWGPHQLSAPFVVQM